MNMKLRILALALCFAFDGPAWAQKPNFRDTQKDSKPCMAGMVMPGCSQTNAAPAHGTNARPVITLQEPENPDRHTGEDLPARRSC